MSSFSVESEGYQYFLSAVSINQEKNTDTSGYINIFAEINSVSNKNVNVSSFLLIDSKSKIQYNNTNMVESEQEFPTMFSDPSYSRGYSIDESAAMLFVGYADSFSGMRYEYESSGYIELYEDSFTLPTMFYAGNGIITLSSETVDYKNANDFSQLLSDTELYRRIIHDPQYAITLSSDIGLSVFLSEIMTPHDKTVNGTGILTVLSNTYMIFQKNTHIRTPKGDFFNSAYDYIKNHLYTINYSSTSSLEILKMKIRVLDGIIWETGLTEYSYNYPLNHYQLLINELNFLDVYIKTQDGTLAENDLNFTDYCTAKEETFNAMLETTNPSTGQLYKDYEIDYSLRPTTMTEVEYQDLYTGYKTKASESPSVITSAQTLVSSANVLPIDYDVYAKKTALENLPTNDEIIENAYNQAMELKEDYDDIYVDNLNNIWAEMWDIIKSLKDTAEDKKDTEPEGTDKNGTSVTFYNEKLFVMNVCLIRAIIDPSDTSSFYGMNVIPSYPYIGGYRYAPWSMETDDVDTDMQAKVIPSSVNAYGDSASWFRSLTAEILPSLSTVSTYLDNSKNAKQDAYNLTAQLDGWANSYFYICQYYEEESTTYDSETKETTTQTRERVKWLCSIYDLPEDDTTTNIPKSKTWDRFIELNKRWVDINRIREDEMQKIGLRFQIESLFGTSIDIDIKTDIQNSMDDLINLKTTFIDMLMENLYYNVYIESNLNG